MNLHHVLAFHRVATAGSFTLAARLVGVSQPTLSAQVRSLERMMGTPLFERAGRRIRLTPVGEALFDATARLGEAIEGVERALARDRSDVRGGLRISADSAVHVFPVLTELKRRVKGLAFSLKIENSANVIAQVINEQADVGVMAKPIRDSRLFTMKIREDRLVLLVNAEDRWAKRARVSVRDLAGRDLVVREKGSITREVAQARLKDANVEPGQVYDVATREAVCEAVAAEFGVGLVFASEVGNDPRLTALSLAEADVGVAEYAICRVERRRLGLIARFFETAHRLASNCGWLVKLDCAADHAGAKERTNPGKFAVSPRGKGASAKLG
jgi:LysR family transcriptional regulator, low CO2-responsive transcriptional regulator